MRLKSGLLLLLCIVSIAGISSAASTPPPGQISYDPSSCSTSDAILAPNPATTIGLTLVALQLAFDVVALGYIFSKMVPATGIANWIRNEYYELTKSVLLVVCIYAAITIVSGIALTFAYNPSIAAFSTGDTGNLFGNVGTLVGESEYYLCSTQASLVPGWQFIGEESLGIGLAQEMSIGLWIPLPLPLPWLGGAAITSGFSMSPYHNFMLESGNVVIQHFESTIFDMVQFVLFPVTAMLSGLVPLLPFLVSLGLTVMIPLGLVFRAFPFIRGIGGTLIAIGIASAVIFPAMLVLLDQPIATWAAQLVPSSAGPTSVPSCNGSLICHLQNVFESFWNGFGDEGDIFYYAWESFFGIYSFYNGMMAATFYMIIQLILFALNLVIVYQLTDSIAKMLGGSIRLSLGNKLKLA